MLKYRPQAFIFALLLLSVFLSIPGLLAHWHNIQVYDLPDNDDFVRLIQIRNWQSGQGFFDTYIHRANPPNGASVHWSRIVDIPFVVFENLFRPFFGIELSEKIALYTLPLIYCGVYIFLVGKIAATNSKSNLSYLLAAGLILFSASASQNFQPGRIDHHNIQSILLLLMFLGLQMGDKNGGKWAGLALGLSIAIGFENLPLQVFVTTAIAINWAIKGESAFEFSSAFLFSSIFSALIGFFIDVAPRNYGLAANDFLSIALLVPYLIGAIGFLIVLTLAPRLQSLRFGALIIIAICVGIAAWCFPIWREPLYWQTSDLLKSIWLNKVPEVRPLYQLPLITQLSVMSGIIFAILLGIRETIHIFKAGTANRNFWSILLMITIISAVFVYFWQNRFHQQATIFATLIICATLPKLISKSGIWILISAIFIIGPIARDIARTAPPQQNGEMANTKSNCKSANDFSHIAKMPKGLILNNIDVGAKALFFTNHDYVTTPFHRDTGKELAADIFLSPSEIAKAKLATHNIDYVVICARDMELIYFSDFAPNSFMAKLRANEIPQFLREIKKPANSDVRAFEIIK